MGNYIHHYKMAAVKNGEDDIKYLRINVIPPTTSSGLRGFLRIIKEIRDILV